MAKKAKEANVADNCILIEKELSKLKLWANLVPLQSFRGNLRYIFSERVWNTIRSTVYRRDEYKCTICKRDNIQLHAHEDWIYDYEKSLQKLNKIITLCDLCHNNIHLGYSGSIGIESREKNRQHWCKINNQNEDDFKKYIFNIIVLWKLKNKIQWKIVDNNGIEITRIKLSIFSVNLKSNEPNLFRIDVCLDVKVNNSLIGKDKWGDLVNLVIYKRLGF